MPSLTNCFGNAKITGTDLCQYSDSRSVVVTFPYMFSFSAQHACWLWCPYLTNKYDTQGEGYRSLTAVWRSDQESQLPWTVFRAWYLCL